MRIGRSGLRAATTALVCGMVLLGACASNDGGSIGDGPGSTARRTAEPGVTRWRVTEASPEPESLVADARGAVAFGRRGEGSAYDRRGNEQWRVNVAGPTGRTVESVGLGVGLVVVPVSEEAGGSRIVALDRSSGAERWTVPFTDVRAVAAGSTVAGATPAESTAAGSGVVAVVTATGVVSLLAATDGTLLASESLAVGALPYVPQVYVEAGVVIVAWTDDGGSRLRAIDASTGATLWGWTGALLGSAPGFTDDALIVVENTEIDGDRVHAVARRLDLASGVEQWARPVDGVFLPSTPVAVSGNLAVLVDAYGTLTGLDVGAGSLRWRRTTDLTQYEATPWIVGDVVAMTTNGTGLITLAAGTGIPVPNDLPAPVQTTVSIEGSAASAGSLLLLVRRPAGEGELWWLRA